MSHLRDLLQESHKDLHQWFLMHQECLLVCQDDYAARSFLAFSSCLIEHIRFENARILPAMSLPGADLRWQVTVYEKEHEKLEKMLSDIAAALDGYYSLSGRVKRLALLDILDRQQAFYRVMEHHEEREEQDLFEHLDNIDSSTGDEWLAAYQAWQSCHGGFLLELKGYLSSR